MAQFHYRARTAEGKRKNGWMEAADEADVQRRLHEEDAFLIDAKPARRAHSRRALKPKLLADFSRQLGTLLGAGVSLVRALRIIADGEATKPKEKEIYEDLIRQIRQGIPLSDAMDAQNGAFPPLMVSMFRSAQSSGNLDQVSMQVALLYEKEHKLNAKISTSLVYPKILAVMIIAVILILTKFVLPRFQVLFDQMETLPLSTRILMGFSYILENYWIAVLLGVILIWLGFRALLRNDAALVQWHRLKLHTPVFGKLQRTVCSSRFARTLSALYSAGIPIVSALQVARKTIGNAYIDSQFDGVIQYVRAGNNLSDGLDRVDGFIRKMSDSIRVGEETGKLDSMLLSTADALEYDADIAITKMVSYIEPGMLIIMGIIVAFVMVSVFGALYGSYDSMSGLS